MAVIQFIRGRDEETIPEVKLTRSKDGNSGRAIFRFDNPKSLVESIKDSITGMYLIDEEGELRTLDVKGVFVNGQPAGLEAYYSMKSREEWDRFMRFMERYAKRNGLGFSSTN